MDKAGAKDLELDDGGIQKIESAGACAVHVLLTRVVHRFSLLCVRSHERKASLFYDRVDRGQLCALGHESDRILHRKPPATSVALL